LGRSQWSFLDPLLPGAIAILSIYLLWSVRRTLNNRFQGRMAILAAVIIGIAQLAGANAKGSDWSELWAALEVLCFVGVGRGISTAARPKWLSLEQLCRLAPVAKATGESLAAGVFYSPLMAAIPFLIVGCGLFPHSSVSAQNLEILYSAAPLLDSGRSLSGPMSAGFFRLRSASAGAHDSFSLATLAGRASAGNVLLCVRNARSEWPARRDP
jgi:hypothetical protein